MSLFYNKWKSLTIHRKCSKEKMSVLNFYIYIYIYPDIKNLLWYHSHQYIVRWLKRSVTFRAQCVPASQIKHDNKKLYYRSYLLKSVTYHSFKKTLKSWELPIKNTENWELGRSNVIDQNFFTGSFK